jgi:hypothetical protein
VPAGLRWQDFGFYEELNSYHKERTMSTPEKLIKARLEMPALAEELQNISLACRRAGISRSHFYEIKEAFEKWGAEGLAPQPRRRTRARPRQGMTRARRMRAKSQGTAG